MITFVRCRRIFETERRVVRKKFFTRTNNEKLVPKCREKKTQGWRNWGANGSRGRLILFKQYCADSLSKGSGNVAVNRC